jgi:hypothetical protein
MPIPALAIRSDAASTASEVFFKAAHAVWQNAGKSEARQAIEVIASDDKTPAGNALWLDLRNRPLDAAARRWVEQGGSLMLGPDTVLPEAPQDVLWRDEQGQAVLVGQSLGAGRFLQWQRPVNAQAMPLLEYGDFPQRLYALLQVPLPAPDRAMATDLQPLLGAPQVISAPKPLSPWFALAAALLFVLERWLASGRLRWGA